MKYLIWATVLHSIHLRNMELWTLFIGPTILLYKLPVSHSDWQYFAHFTKHVPDGLVARIRRSHRRGPGSIPGQGKRGIEEAMVCSDHPTLTIIANCSWIKDLSYCSEIYTFGKLGMMNDIVSIFLYCINVLFLIVIKDRLHITQNISLVV